MAGQTQSRRPTGKQTAAGAAVAAILGAAALFVQPWEGRELKPYRDLVGVLTVCDGHTGPDIRTGKTYTDAECDAWLQIDLAKAYASVEGCITTPLTVNQAAAFTSLAYNTGSKGVCGSTLQRKANAGDLRGACDELLRWKYAKGRVVQGLLNRRKAERELCLRN